MAASRPGARSIIGTVSGPLYGPSGPGLIAGGSPDADPIDPIADRRWYILLPAILCAAATLFFGVLPQPLVDFANEAAASLASVIS